MSDWNIKAGDEFPILTDTLTLANGTIPNFNGATLQFIMRALTSANPQPLTGVASFSNIATGAVQFAPTSADTAIAGSYMANWLVTFPSGNTMTWPTDGYLWVDVEQNLLTSQNLALVSLPDVKEYLSSFGMGVDRSHDAKLMNYIYAATPVIENITGPVIIRTFDEWHQGGQFYVRLRRRPSTAIGMNPVITIMAVDEYRGPVKYALSIVGTPTEATIYSVMLDKPTGTLYRRTTGGGVIAFGAGPFGGAMPDAVHVIYQAGQASVPANVREATLESIRQHYQNTMATGTGSRALVDLEPAGVGPAFTGLVDRIARQALAPMKRHPAIA